MTTIQEAGELDSLLCFDLYAASRAVTAAYRPILGELGLTYPQYLVLTVVGARGEVPIKTLASTLRLDHGTLTPLLRRLEATGLLTRTRSADDERSVLVALTSAGHEVATRFGGVQCRIGEALGLEIDDVHRLQGLLRTVTASASR